MGWKEDGVCRWAYQSPKYPVAFHGLTVDVLAGQFPKVAPQDWTWATLARDRPNIMRREEGDIVMLRVPLSDCPM